MPLRLAIWDQGAQLHRQCPGLTELGCLALILLEETRLGDASSRWPWLRVDTMLNYPPWLAVFPESIAPYTIEAGLSFAYAFVCKTRLTQMASASEEAASQGHIMTHNP